MDNIIRRQMLSGAWRLTGRRKGDHPELHFDDAAVPGNIEIELEKHGVVPELFFGQNAKLLRPYEFYDFTYERDFDCALDGENLVLHLDGVDCLAEVFLNGVKLGACDNAFIPHAFPIKGVVKKRGNRLEVRLKSVVEAGKTRPLSALATTPFVFDQEMVLFRKPAHELGWDISFRMMLGGLWRDVWIGDTPRNEISELFLDTASASEESANLQCCFKIATDGFEEHDKLFLELAGRCEDHRWQVVQPVWSYSGRFPVRIEHPRLWNPRHYGKPDLYTVEAALKTPGGATLAVKTFKLGIRTIRLERAAVATPGDAPDFRFFVNDRPVRLWGTNHVPADVLHSRDKEQYRVIKENLLELECNMVRCWGGGVYEQEEFFDFCDEHGILIWQDFMLACALYPQDHDFQENLEREARYVVSALRRHPSLALWSGDNECDLIASWIGLGAVPPETNELTRRLLPAVCRDLDPRRPYLESSPYVSPEAFALSRKNRKPRLEYLPETHLWFQEDPYDSPLYTGGNPSFVSEIGRIGCPDEETLRRMMPEESLWPAGNDDWYFHGCAPYLGDSDHFRERCRALLKGVEVFLGGKAENLHDFVLASQLYQLEGVKFLLEHFRSREKCTGLLWWNLKDAAPLLSDAAVDYFGRRKLLWHYLKNFHAGVFAMMRASGGALRVELCNDTASDYSGHWEIFDGETGKSVARKDGVVAAGQRSVTELELPCETRLLLLEWTRGKKTYRNHLLMQEDKRDLLAYCRKNLLPWYHAEEK